MLQSSVSRPMIQGLAQRSGRGTFSRWAALDKPSVADLSTEAIDIMERDDLIEVICAAGLPMRHDAEMARWVQLCDPQALRRLAHVARRSCRTGGY